MRFNKILAPLAVGLIVGCGPGERWDSASTLDLQGPAAMTSVNQFVAINGWNMISKDGGPFDNNVQKPITGLPWKRLTGKTYPAVTENSILYVLSNPGGTTTTVVWLIIPTRISLSGRFVASNRLGITGMFGSNPNFRARRSHRYTNSP
jgi:hypothetical protein